MAGRGDFRLNSTRLYDQALPSLATLKGGGFVAVWEDTASDPGFEGGTGVYGRIFDDRGGAMGAEFRIPGKTGGDQLAPKVAALKDGGFAVAWMSDGLDRRGDDLYLDSYLRFFDADGSPRTREIEITRGGSVDHRIQDLAVLRDGSVLAATASSDIDTDWLTRAWRFDADGARLERSVIDRSAFTGYASPFGVSVPGVDIAPLADGGYLAAWWEERAPVQGVHQQGAVLARAFDADGAARGPARVVTEASATRAKEYPQVATLPGDKVAVVWSGEQTADLVAPRDVYFRVLGPDGAPATREVLVNAGDRAGDQIAEDVTHLGKGVTLVTYRSYDAANSGSGHDYYAINGRIFGADGRPLSGVFGISEKVYEDVENAQAILLHSGKLFVSWSGGGILEEDVFGRVFDLGTTIDGTRRADRIFGSPLAETIRGRGGDDVLRGARGDDRLFGGSGDDNLGGGAGADRLAGGTGRDVLRGGPGDDVFVFAPRAGRDIVKDFSDGDRVDVRAFDLPDRLPAGALRQVGDDVRLEIGSDEMIFKHTDLADLDGAFLF